MSGRPHLFAKCLHNVHLALAVLLYAKFDLKIILLNSASRQARCSLGFEQHTLSCLLDDRRFEFYHQNLKSLFAIFNLK